MIPPILGRVQPWFAGLEGHLTDILVGGIIELSKGLVLGWVELSAGLMLASENQANYHHLDYVDECDILANHALNTRLEQ